MTRLNAVEYNRILPLRRELYYADEAHAEGLSYNLKLHNVRDEAIRNKLFELWAVGEDEFFNVINRMTDQFDSNNPDYTAGMCGRMGGHLCLFQLVVNGPGRRSFYSTDASTPAPVKRAFRKLACDIRKAYIEWAREELASPDS